MVHLNRGCLFTQHEDKLRSVVDAAVKPLCITVRKGNITLNRVVLWTVSLGRLTNQYNLVLRQMWIQKWIIAVIFIVTHRSDRSGDSKKWIYDRCLPLSLMYILAPARMYIRWAHNEIYRWYNRLLLIKTFWIVKTSYSAETSSFFPLFGSFYVLHMKCIRTLLDVGKIWGIVK